MLCVRTSSVFLPSVLSSSVVWLKPGAAHKTTSAAHARIFFITVLQLGAWECGDCMPGRDEGQAVAPVSEKRTSPDLAKSQVCTWRGSALGKIYRRLGIGAAIAWTGRTCARHGCGVVAVVAECATCGAHGLGRYLA